MHRTIRYEVDVVGRIWQGCRSAYTYKLTGNEDVTDAVARTLVGDFATVDDWRATKIESTVEYVSERESVFTTRYSIVHDWTRKGSQRHFEKCTMPELARYSAA